MDDKQRQLVADNHGLIYHMLKMTHREVSEYYDVAAIGLCKAAMAYSPDKGAFSTFACQCILFELNVDDRWHDRVKRRVDKDALHYNVRTDEGSEMLDLMVSTVDPEHEAINKCYVADILSELTPREIDIFRAMARGYTQNEIAKRCCLSRQRINFLVKEARRKLARYGIKEAASWI